MNLALLLKLLALAHFITLSEHSHVQEAKRHIRAGIVGHAGRWPPGGPPLTHHHHHQQRKPHHSRWSGRRRSIERHQHFTAWSAWSVCGGAACVQRRERYCRAKRKCGHTKHVEERKCWGACHAEAAQTATALVPERQQSLHHNNNSPQAIIINAAGGAAAPSTAAATPATTTTTTEGPWLLNDYDPVRMPVLEQVLYDEEPDEGEHYYQPHHAHQQLSRHQEAQTAHGPWLRSDSAEYDDDFYALRRPRQRLQRQHRQRTAAVNQANDYMDTSEEQLGDYDDGQERRRQQRRKRVRHQHKNRRGDRRGQQKRQNWWALAERELEQRDLEPVDEGIEGDFFQYEDFDFGREGGGRLAAADRRMDVEYGDSYEDLDYADGQGGNVSATQPPPSREKEGLLPRGRRIYSKWSRWTKCTPKCTTRRYKKCRVREQCGREVLREIAYCYTEGSFCQQWLQAQVQRQPAYELRPVVTAARRREVSDSAHAAVSSSNNAIVSANQDYIMNGKGYRGPEYSPLKLKCGIASVHRSGNGGGNNRRNMYNMLKIIGGKAARKGEWPWQVAIFNRFKEAFCGGTLIAPQWVLTAAHCVRKVLYVRIGEHNLDYEDGTELQLRVLRSFKHPNFDKKTVDSDVALLKLPKPANASTWVGFSCLPRPYQPLPKNVDCTVIGWGKRRHRDISGTSVLHQAEVPIISMDHCRAVYQDYTITKNMFCAGHKRGRIDTCAGDSGGPLLCRDTTKPNHPWTIFGITSFGDGCAKRNKFGIYAKVPNYVDWAWSVINCNGNCKLRF